MDDARLDNELKRIHENLRFLWDNYGFHVKYFRRDHGMYYRGFLIGLENELCKLIFEKETNSSVEPIKLYVGKKNAPFAPPNFSFFTEDDWYTLSGLIYWLSGVEYESFENVDEDLESVSQYLKLNIDKLLDLFKSPDEFDRKIEYYRNLYKEKQVTVEKLRAERARLYALGQDSSVEAAIASLRGGKNE